MRARGADQTSPSHLTGSLREFAIGAVTQHFGNFDTSVEDRVHLGSAGEHGSGPAPSARAEGD
jgi:hypothetical protein